jgi:hypothetical protein
MSSPYSQDVDLLLPLVAAGEVVIFTHLAQVYVLLFLVTVAEPLAGRFTGPPVVEAKTLPPFELEN